MLSILMALAMLFHARRAGEGRNIALNFILFVLAAIVACGRNAVVPLVRGRGQGETDMFETLFPLSSDVGLLILRLGLAFVFVVHGWPKLNPNGPLKGPAGFAGWLKQMGVPLPMLFAWIVALLETIGAGLVILGLATRLLALTFAVIMLVAIWAKRRFMKVGFTAQQATGWELDFILLAAALTLVLTGPGALALDPLLGF